MVRVLVIDDSVFMRTLIRDMAGKDPGITVLGTASDGIEALRQIQELRPDVVTLDIEMPRMNGLEVLEKLQGFPARPKVLMLSSLTARGAEMTERAIRLGADDFMLKPTGIAEVRRIEEELIAKIRHLVTIPASVSRGNTASGPAERVVLIGSSAGGPPMVDTVLGGLPADLAAAVVVIQHMPVGFTAALAARFHRLSPIPVKETGNGEVLKAGQVYVAKAGIHAVIAHHMASSGRPGGKIVHAKSPPVHAVRPAVDITFASAAKVFGKEIVSVILSGMGNDGGEGMAAIKAAGGVTMVAREEDCLVYGMARSALERQCVDRVMPLDRIAAEIGAAVRGLGG